MCRKNKIRLISWDRKKAVSREENWGGHRVTTNGGGRQIYPRMSSFLGIVGVVEDYGLNWQDGMF